MQDKEEQFLELLKDMTILIKGIADDTIIDGLSFIKIEKIDGEVQISIANSYCANLLNDITEELPSDAFTNLKVLREIANKINYELNLERSD